jgi:lipopolysaccharide assembly outer membrane protein LptD (OstA)
MMSRTLGIAVEILILLILFPTAARAENTQAKVTADEVSYDYELQQVEAIGHVKIEYKDMKIEADYALLDQEQDILLATGQLVVTNNKSVYHGNKFLYFLKTEQGWIYPLAAEITDLNIKGSAYITAAEAFVKGEDLKSKHSTFTTCDLEHPHYHLSAKEIEYYPGDVIIMRHVWYYEQFVPIFYLPVLYISLKDDKDNFSVQYGQSSTEGFYIDTKYYYFHFPNETDWGNLEVRLTQYGGNLYEIDHSHATSKTGTFVQKYGILEKRNMTNPAVSSYTRTDGATYESQYDDYMLGFSYKEYLNPKVLTNQELERWYHFTEDGDLFLNTIYNLGVTGQSPYPSLTLAFKDKYEETYRTVNLTSNWNYSPDKTSSISLNGQWYYYGYLASDNLYLSRLYTLNAKKDWNWSNLALTVSENRSYSTSTSGTSLLPNIIYTIPKVTLPVLNDIKIAAQYTKMEKYSSSTTSEGERYALDFDKSSGTIWEQGPFTLINESSLKYRDFLVSKTETDLYSLSTQMGLKDQFTKEFYTKLNVGYAETAGTTNSYFSYDGDDDLPGFYAQNSWSYSGKSLTASASTKYNFETQYAYPLTISSSWKLASIANITLSTIYYWGEGPGQTNFSANYHPNANCTISIGLGYNFLDTDSPWTSQSFVADVSGKISRSWSYSLSATYNYLAQEFSVAEYNLIYDWHCRQVVFHFDEVEKEYYVQIVIKAFPNSSLKLTGTDTLDNLLSGIETE